MSSSDSERPGTSPFMVAHPDTSSLPADPEAAVMMRNGITRTAIYQYHVDGYRYTSLDAAMAQVRRGSIRRQDGALPA